MLLHSPWGSRVFISLALIYVFYTGVEELIISTLLITLHPIPTPSSEQGGVPDPEPGPEPPKTEPKHEYILSQPMLSLSSCRWSISRFMICERAEGDYDCDEAEDGCEGRDFGEVLRVECSSRRSS